MSLFLKTLHKTTTNGTGDSIHSTNGINSNTANGRIMMLPTTARRDLQSHIGLAWKDCHHCIIIPLVA